MKRRLNYKSFIIMILLAMLALGCNQKDINPNNDDTQEVVSLKSKIEEDEGNSFKGIRNNLFEQIKDDSVAIFYSGIKMHRTADQYYRFEPDRNFFYLTGLSEANMILLMQKSDVNSSYLFIEENNEITLKWEGAKITKEEASDISGISTSNIYYIDKFDQFFNSTIETSNEKGKPVETLYVDVLSGNGSVNIQSNDLRELVKDKYPEILVAGINDHLDNMRIYKSDNEIAEIVKAIEYTKNGIIKMMENCKPSLYEYQLQSYFNQTLTYNNTYESFNSIIASGDNGTILHYEKNNSLIDDGSLILIDVGALSNNYAADISRTIPADGKFSDRQRQIYEIVLETNKKTIEQVKPGVTWNELQSYSKSIMAEGLKDLGIINDESEISEYYYHYIGHHLGLDVHDTAVGFYKPLEEGMVITIEPGLYIPEEHIGIRIEDNILVTKDGYENLSKDIIKEIDDIEEFMNKN